jgi:glycosyltransferase involved in cell wall biosynthesis
VEALFANYHSEEWVSYIVKSIMEGIAGPNVTVGATVMAKAASVQKAYVHPVMHRTLYDVVRRHLPDPMAMVCRFAERRLRAGDAAYFWGGNPVCQSEEFKSRGIMIVREMINCTRALRRDRLRRAYEQLGMPDGSGISDQMIEEEKRELLCADVVFCPSQFVRRSVLDYGVAPERCIDASYGWGHDRMSGTTRVVPDDGTFTVCFVGTVDVRKGAPVLLDAWKMAGIKGRLLIAGEISPEVQRRYSAVLARPDVIPLGYVEDVGAVYRSSDAFCLPSWEEGAPLVVFEAMAAGAVPIVTSIASGGTFSASEEIGIEVPPGDVEALSRALGSLAEDEGRRREMKRRALSRALDFTWGQVGVRRRRALTRARRDWLHDHASSV